MRLFKTIISHWTFAQGATILHSINFSADPIVSRRGAWFLTKVISSIRSRKMVSPNENGLFCEERSVVASVLLPAVNSKREAETAVVNGCAHAHWPNLAVEHGVTS